VEHSVELQALAVRTGNVLVNQLWPIRNRATMTSSLVIFLYGSTAPDMSRCFWIQPSYEPHKGDKLFCLSCPWGEANVSTTIGRCIVLKVAGSLLVLQTFFSS